MNFDFRYALLLLIGVFISAVSQVMLKKSAERTYEAKIKEYCNPLVAGAYILFIVTTFLSVFAYKGIPLSMGPILEATSYIYITFFGITIFHEEMTRSKWLALFVILLGICLYSFGAGQ